MQLVSTTGSNNQFVDEELKHPHFGRQDTSEGSVIESTSIRKKKGFLANLPVQRWKGHSAKMEKQEKMQNGVNNTTDNI